jgi:hypothetical protein
VKQNISKKYPDSQGDEKSWPHDQDACDFSHGLPFSRMFEVQNFLCSSANNGCGEQ